MSSPPPPLAAEPVSNTGAWTVGGFVLTGAAAAAVIATLVSGIVFIEQKDPINARDTLIVGLSTGGALLGLGSIAFAVDAL